MWTGSAARRHWLAAQRIPDLLQALLVGVAAFSIGAFLVAALFRLTYPFPLEVTEAPMLREVERVLRGEPIYVAPRLEYVPLVYGPLHAYLAAGVALLTGPTYAALRLVSLVASIGTLALVYDLVRRETGSRAAGLVSAGLLAASYPLAETALDLGRVDALFVFLIVAALYLARVPLPVGRWALILAGCSIGLAALTKVPLGAAPIALAIVIYLLLIDPRGALAFILSAALVLGIALVLLRLQTGPWATWYVWDLPRRHELRESLIARFWFMDFLNRFTFALVLGPVFVVGRAVLRNWPPVLFYGLSAPALIALAWVSRSSSGGGPNVLLPAHVAAAVLLGLGLAEALARLSNGAPASMAFRAYALVLCILQFGLIAYNPRLMVPYRSDQQADERLAARLAALPGEIFAPGFDGYVGGGGEQPHPGAVEEITGGYGGPPTAEGRAWQAALDRGLHDRRFSHIVLAEDDCCLKATVLGSGYVDAGPLFPPGDAFYSLKSRRTPEVHLYRAPNL